MASRRPAIGTLVAWTAIVPATVLVVMLRALPSGAEPKVTRLDRALLEVQARYSVGAAVLLGRGAADPFGRTIGAETPPWQRLRLATVAGELSGPRGALAVLRSASPPGGRPIADILARLYRDYARGEGDAPSVTPGERKRLAGELGWFGRLALAPPGTASPERERVMEAARHTVYAVIGGFAAAATVGLAGLWVLTGFAVRLARDRLSRFDPAPRRGGVYAETFALWLVLFVLSSVLGAGWLGPETPASVSLLAIAGSTLALAWPRARGVRWRVLAADLGWTRGAGVARELAAGLGCYAMGLALIVLAALALGLFVSPPGPGAGPGPAPVHPIAEWLVGAGWWQRVQLLALACVVAPVVEETVFRGLLYRHLREATVGLPNWAGVVVSAAASGILFGALHPQGLPALPGIIGIGVALAFTREWRGAIGASVLGHAVNNAVTLLALTALLAL